jgi:hypothetical protein
MSVDDTGAAKKSELNAKKHEEKFAKANTVACNISHEIRDCRIL